MPDPYWVRIGEEVEARRRAIDVAFWRPLIRQKERLETMRKRSKDWNRKQKKHSRAG